MIIHLIAGLIKKIWCDFIECNCKKISTFFPKSFRSFKRNINVKLDLSNYATKTKTLKIFNMLILQVLH